MSLLRSILLPFLSCVAIGASASAQLSGIVKDDGAISILANPESMFLTPIVATVPTGGTHGVTVTVLDATTDLPIVGRDVNFTVISGPNAGTTGSGTTNSFGMVPFFYSGTQLGTDSLVADMINGNSMLQTSDTVTADWVGAQNYCTAKINSCGSAPTLTAPFGATSQSASSAGTFDLVVAPVDFSAGRPIAIAIYSTSGQMVPANSVFGWLCVNTSESYRALPTKPTGSGCTAAFTLDFGDYLATQTQDQILTQENLPAQVDLQVWYRDPADTLAGGALTEAITFFVNP